MRNAIQILSASQKITEASQLRELLEEAIQLASFHETKTALANDRLHRAQEQIKRQTQMIENLEKTLWNKR